MRSRGTARHRAGLRAECFRRGLSPAHDLFAEHRESLLERCTVRYCSWFAISCSGGGMAA